MVMAQLPDLVRDSKLEVTFLPNSIVHTFHESSPSSHQRGVTRSEHWRREKQIGAGSFGSIWLEKCTDGRRSGEVRAIKQIRTILSATRTIDCTGELEAIAKFSHRKYEHCFVKSFGWYEDDENLYIALEYLGHGDLYAYLSDSEPLAEQDAKTIVHQVLEGLNFMHENRYAHRDLKTNNILLKSCPPNPWWVKIADFGISKRIEYERGGSTAMKGTLGFMAPETHGFTPRGSIYAVDMWSLGEIAFQIIIKQQTFPNLGLLSRYVQGLQEFPSAALRERNVSPPGVEFVSSAMNPIPDTRLDSRSARNHAWMLGIPSSTSPNNASTASKIRCRPLSLSSPQNATASPPMRSTNNTGIPFGTITSSGRLGSWNTMNSSNSPTPYSPDFDTRSLATFTTYTTMSREIQSLNLKMNRKYKPHKGSIYCVAFSRDGEMIASGGSDRAVRLWSVAAGELLDTITFDSPVRSIAFSPNKPIIACSVDRKSIKIYDYQAKTHCSDPQLPKADKTPKNLTFSPDGSMIAGVYSLTTVRVWNYTAKTLQQESQPDDKNGGRGWRDPVIVFSPDGRLVASDIDYGYIKIWETATGSPKFEFTHDGGSRKGLAFSPDSKTLAVGSIGKATLWNTVTGKKRHSCRLGTERINDAVFTLAFSPDGGTLMIAGGKHRAFYMLWPKEGWISLCDVATGTVIDTRRDKLPCTGDVVNCSPDGRIIAFGGNDGTLVLWSWQ